MSSRARQVRRSRQYVLTDRVPSRRKTHTGKISAEERRHRILAAALEAFAEQGFAAAQYRPYRTERVIAPHLLYLFVRKVVTKPL